jgi:aspartate kinase
LRLTIQKYGGTSLSTVRKIQKVAEQVVQIKRSGSAVVVVVSAMGSSTDMLLDLARQIGPRLSPRELDILLGTGETVSTALLCLAVQNLGEESIALSAIQSGIITNEVHSNARIQEIRPHRIKKELARGVIVVIPGFLGVTGEQELTTLGRGGSDTSAVALAAALGAKECFINTDVDGVYSADPCLIPEAIKLERLEASEMQELAWHGAQVLKAEAVEFAKTSGVSIVVRSTFKNGSGTLIRPDAALSQTYRPRQTELTGVSGRKDIIRITFRERNPTESQLSEVFSAVSKYDMIFGTVGNPDEPIDVFISSNEIPDTEAFVRELAIKLPNIVTVIGELGAVSLVGLGLGSRLTALLDASIELKKRDVTIIKSFTNRESLTFVIPQSRVDDCVKRMHTVFIERR